MTIMEFVLWFTAGYFVLGPFVYWLRGVAERAIEDAKPRFKRFLSDFKRS